MDFLSHSGEISLSSAIQLILAWQVVILFALAAWVVMIIVFRRTWGARRRSRSVKLQEFIVEQVLLSMENKKLHRPSLGFTEKSLYRDLLINTIITLNGKEHSALVDHYIELEYFARDEKTLSSRLWWRRLAAVIRLSQLENEKTSAALMRAAADEHELVAQIAYEALSRLKIPHVAAFVLEHLKQRPPAREDLLIELLHGSGQVLGNQSILSILHDTARTEMKTAAVKVLGKLGATEALSDLMDICFAPDQSPELLAAALTSLRLIGHPHVEEVVLQYLNHPSPRVRMAAVELGASLESEEINHLIDLLALDPSIEVRRVVHVLHKKVVA